MSEDSRPATWEHIHKVQELLFGFIRELLTRAQGHDLSKLESPEVEVFNEHTNRLKDLTYDSPEYKKSLKVLEDTLAHHYAKNEHHPEHFTNGVDDMTLVDLIEMLCDWKAATLRQHDGNIRKSLMANKIRFHLSDQLERIMKNTIERFGW